MKQQPQPGGAAAGLLLGLVALLAAGGSGVVWLAGALGGLLGGRGRCWSACPRRPAAPDGCRGSSTTRPRRGPPSRARSCPAGQSCSRR